LPTIAQIRIRRVIKRLTRIADADDASARKLLRRLEAMLAEFDTEPQWVSQLRSLDHRAFARRHGIEALRSLLDDFNSAELKEFAKDRGIVSGGLSKLTKGDVVNRIVFAAKAA
jgi:hypothetical protein